jgi:hypothetical protein
LRGKALKEPTLALPLFNFQRTDFSPTGTVDLRSERLGVSTPGRAQPNIDSPRSQPNAHRSRLRPAFPSRLRLGGCGTSRNSRRFRREAKIMGETRGCQVPTRPWRFGDP